MTATGPSSNPPVSNLPVRRIGGRAGLLAAVSLALTLSASAEASACPSCASGRQARREVWTTDFGGNLLVTALPFIVLAAIGAAVDQRDRRGNRASAETAPLESRPINRKVRS